VHVLVTSGHMVDFSVYNDSESNSGSEQKSDMSRL